MKRKNLMLAVCAAFGALGAVAANFPVGTHLCKGSLKDWQNKVLSSASETTVQAVATNGVVLASTKVTNPTADGYNFLLQIPLSTTATASTAAVGDSLNCVILQGSGSSLTTNVTTSAITVGGADAASTLNLVFVDMKTYTNGTTKAVVQIPAEYVEATASWMGSYGKTGDYDPFADYDGDGVSNYDEYLAGTDPFDASHKLAITDYAAPENAPHPITFEYVGGHVYGVVTTLSLTNIQWKAQRVKASETADETDQVAMPADEDEGLATIYVVPAGGATSQFFKMEAK